MRQFGFAFLAPLAVTLALVAAGGGGLFTRFAVAPGIEFTQEIAADGPLVIDALRLDLKRPGVRVQSALGRHVVITDETSI